MDPDYGGKVRGLKYSYSMKRHMDPDDGGKVRGLKYSYSMKRHMDPDYGGKVRGLKYSYSMKRHRGLEITSGDTCHVRATVLPSRINLPILQELLHAICRRGWPMVRCVGTHNRIALTDELQLCSHGFFVQMTVTGVVPAHALDISRWSQHAGRLLHLDFQSYTGDFHLF